MYRLVVASLFIVLLVASAALFFSQTGRPAEMNVEWSVLRVKPVEGDDIPCIGNPGGTRVYYAEKDGAVAVAYALLGRKEANVVARIKKRAEECRFILYDVSRRALPGVLGWSAAYYRDGFSEELLATVFESTASDGNTYTVAMLALIKHE